MVIFASEAFRTVGRGLEKGARATAGRFSISRFDNGELRAVVQTQVSGEDCIILGSIAPPDQELLSLLLLAHTLKKERAQSVTALLPYLAYSRQDKLKPGESLAAAWTGLLMEASGVDKVITVDVHSSRDLQLFPIPLISISPAPVFADAIHHYELTQATIVAPDNGAVHRCAAVKAAAGMPAAEIPYFEKRRTETGIIHAGPIGRVGRKAVLVDDILDTGTTLVSASERLASAGVEEIYIMVTDGLFTGCRWEGLWSHRVKRIFCTDTKPLARDLDTDGIELLSITPLLEQSLSSLTTSNVQSSISIRRPE